MEAPPVIEDEPEPSLGEQLPDEPVHDEPVRTETEFERDDAEPLRISG
ncbi:MAG: hypothetical protein ACR2HP_01210 [Ilumatobacteraceae bacterium]